MKRFIRNISTRKASPCILAGLRGKGILNESPFGTILTCFIFFFLDDKKCPETSRFSYDILKVTNKNKEKRRTSMKNEVSTKKKFLRVSKVAEITGLSVWFWYRALSSKKIPSYKISNRRLIFVDDLEKIMQGFRQEPLLKVEKDF